MSKSASGERQRPCDLDPPISELRLGGDLDGLRDAVEREVADQRDVGGRSGERGGGNVDRLGHDECRGRELVGLEALGPQPVVTPTLVRGDRRGVDVQGAGRQPCTVPSSLDGDRSRHVGRAADRVGFGREVGELFPHPIAGDAVSADLPLAGDAGVGAGRNARRVLARGRRAGRLPAWASGSGGRVRRRCPLEGPGRRRCSRRPRGRRPPAGRARSFGFGSRGGPPEGGGRLRRRPEILNRT